MSGRNSERNAEKTQQQKNQRLSEDEDIKIVMSTPEGRRFVNKLLERAGIYRCSFNGQSNNTIFNEGGRNQGLMLLSDIQTAAPGSYATMLKEKNDG